MPALPVRTFFVLALLTASIAAQGQPMLELQSSFGTSPSYSPRGFFASPDFVTVTLDAGPARAFASGGITVALAMQPPQTIPGIPDPLGIDLNTVVFTLPVVLNQNGRFLFSVPFGPGLAEGWFVAMQAYVATPGEAAPLRLSQAMGLVVLDGSASSIYVDGDQTGAGSGTPYDPWPTINDAFANLPAGPATVHVDDVETAPGLYEEIVFVPSDVHLIGDTWYSQSGVRPVVRAPVDSNGHVKRGSVNVLQANNVTVERLEVHLSRHVSRVQARCFWCKTAGNLTVRDCVFTGMAPGVYTTRAVFIGPDSDALVEHCTVTDIEGDPNATGVAITISGIGIRVGGGGTSNMTVRNCRIQNFYTQVLPGISHVQAIGIGFHNAQNVILQNNVIGPFLVGPHGGATGELIGIQGTLNPTAQQVFANNVIFDFSLVPLSGASAQVFGMRLFGPSGATWNLTTITNNIIDNLDPGTAFSIASTAYDSPDSLPLTVDYTCIDQVMIPFSPSSFIQGPGIILADPLLDPVDQSLLPGSPCIGTGNPALPPPDMGIFGGPFAGPAGAF